MVRIVNLPRSMRKISTTANARPTAVAYLRVSTLLQATEGHSIDAQRARVEAYALAHGLDLVSVEVDAGASAGTLRRPGLDRALALLKAGKAQTLICYSLSRLTRSVRDLCELVDTYFRDGARSLVSLTENVDTSSAMGRGILAIIVAIGGIEREQAGERTAAVKSYQRNQNRFLGGDTPYGVTVEGGALVPVESEQSVIALARDLRASGLSYRAVASTLDERGIRARNGRAFLGAQIQRMTSRTSPVPQSAALAA